jgi:hypothetical protein
MRVSCCKRRTVEPLDSTSTRIVLYSSYLNIGYSRTLVCWRAAQGPKPSSDTTLTHRPLRVPFLPTRLQFFRYVAEEHFETSSLRNWQVQASCHPQAGLSSPSPRTRHSDFVPVAERPFRERYQYPLCRGDVSPLEKRPDFGTRLLERLLLWP